MNKNKQNGRGSIEIAPPIVAAIAARAVSNVPGVVELRSGIGEEFAKIVGRESQTSGVKVISEEEQEVSLEVHIVAEYKYSLAKLSKKLSERVKREVESIADVKVKSVSVFVDDIALPKGRKASAS